MTFGRCIFHCAVLLAIAQFGHSIDSEADVNWDPRELYEFERTIRLENGAGKSEFIKLDTPINFYSDIYDHIYLNTPGILTFGVELNSFLNVPFPLEYASIAPFYSNIDTTNAGPDTSISFSKLYSEKNNRRAEEAIRKNFDVNESFRVVNVLVATWENVGHYRENNTEQNTFQAAIICGEQDTFVQFLYPRNGLNWLQGDQGESGLPDIRAQAGFIAEDGRYFTVVGSGTENAKLLREFSNMGHDGSWIFRVGHLGFEENVKEPVLSNQFQTLLTHPRSCGRASNTVCHPSAICRDTHLSFACQCKPEYYGNGFNCIKKDVPLRVSGKVTGNINNYPVDAQLQSYVVMEDGRSYSAISPLENGIGHSTQLVYAFSSVIGWLFAKPVANDNAKNGYQLTGGKLNHTATIRFTTPEGETTELVIVQKFNGLNVWDQLAVDIEVNGNLPTIRSNAQLIFPDTSASYEFLQENQIQSDSSGTIRVDEQSIPYNIHQLIDFQTFRETGEPESEQIETQTFFNKVSKITSQYQERETALRIGMINKVVRNVELNPCTDGTATCHENSFCVPDAPNDSYLCECKNGFYYDDSVVACVDIDECATSANKCDPNADCYNELGSYNCRCRDEFNGNGLTCYPDESQTTPESSTYPTDDRQCKNGFYYDESSRTCVDIDECSRNVCDENADCVNRLGSYNCYCRGGFYGDGSRCFPNQDSFETTEESSTNPTTDRQCKNGFYFDDITNTCVDIDECDRSSNICDENADCVNRLGGYNCYCRGGFYGNGFKCYPEDGRETTQEPESSTYQESTPNIPGLAPEAFLCDQCSEHADCNKGICVCRNGWRGDGIECTYACPDDSVWNIDRCELINPNSEEDEETLYPLCNPQGCTCADGFELIETVQSKICRPLEKEVEVDAKLPCDSENTCHPNAVCEFNERELQHKCVCSEGYEGDGYECVERETSCLFNERICDVHASCTYDQLIGKSVCKCNKRYEGDGRSCQLAPECAASEDCSENAYCSDGVCVCNEGYERDISDFCVPSGYCGGTFCATNAVCLWDTILNVQYCSCPEGFVGDGLQSCKSVPPSCNVKNNCGLNAQCVPTHNNTHECACSSGFYGDGFVCVPEINCINVPSLCHENGRCISTKSGYQCICNAGFIGNGTFCTEPVRQEHAFLLLSQGVAIAKIPVDGKRSTPIAMSGMAIGIDKDCSTGRVYWSDISTKQIYSSKYDGSDRRTFISDDIVSPEGIAIDWISRRIYWTDSSKDTIEVASLDDASSRAVIVKGNLVNPRGIAVDPHQNKLYWSDWNRESPKIEQSDLDGTNRIILLQSPEINLPNSLSISTRTGELCYADAGTQKIECIEPYRRSVRTISTNLSYPFGLAVTSDRFYWTDWTTKKIESCDDRGSRFSSIANPLFGNHKMYGIVAVTSECPLFFSQCQINNGDCPSNTICLINPTAPSGRFCKPTAH